MSKISIIVPVYNTENFLEQCLDSLLSQTYKDIEIILLNDGSTDHSGEICDEFARKDTRVIVIHQPNKGLSETRNIGIEVSSGDYIMFVDSDDWIEPTTCEDAIKLGKKLDADIVFWSYWQEFNKKSVKKKVLKTKQDFKLFIHNGVKTSLHRRMFGLLEDELKTPENMDSLVTATMKLYKASLLKQNNIFFVDCRLIGTEDALFNIYAFGHCSRALFLNQEYYHYRKYNPNSLSSNHQSDLFYKWKNLFTFMQAYIQANQLGKEYLQALNNRICLSVVGLGLTILNKSSTPREAIALLSHVLHDEMYSKAFQNLALRHFEGRWKLFFYLAKTKKSRLLYLLLFSIRFMLRRKNKHNALRNSEGTGKVNKERNIA